MCYLFLNLLIPTYSGLNAPYWSYSGILGPDHWPQYFPNCGGMSQSPIDIIPADTVPSFNGSLPLNFKNYNHFTVKTLMKNNGHSVEFTTETPYPPTVEGGPLTGTYQLVQYHFHWGHDDTRGSEHTIDGFRYPSELHFVHYKTTYGSPEEAARHPDGLAVLAVFLEITPNENLRLGDFLTGIEDIRASGTNVTVAPIPLVILLPVDVNKFFAYKGSLTTPTCDEVVTWIVFRDTLKISSSQLSKFRTLRDNQGQPLLHNYRPTQKLNDRKVYYWST